MLAVYLVMVAVTAVIAISSVLLTTSRVDQRSHASMEQADAAALASQISVDLRESVSVMFATTYAFLQSNEADGLQPDVMTDVLDPEKPLNDIPLAAMTIDISERNAFELQANVHAVSERIDALLAYSGGGMDLAPVIEQRDKLDAALATYLETKSASSFRDTFSGIMGLGARLNAASTSFGAALDNTQSDLASATRVASYTMIGALTFLLLVMIGGTLYVSRLIRGAFQSGEAERHALQATTDTLQYRNDQLNALYNVFSEITDTLSMRYVISATLRETLRVMKASFVTLRLLKNGQLVGAGSLTVKGERLGEVPPVSLGEGPSGRVARRGRSMRIDVDAQEMLGLRSDEQDSDVQSGVIVPLIVGARIVGTLECWSHEAFAFQEGDERVLEMMASQVATAVVAADTQETLERRALSDPLTNLPNRRQLTEDMTEFARWHQEERSAVVAMVDIDHFKQLNDDFGHKVGDVTLQKVASVMRQAIRDTDRIYRYGGEEFVIIFSGAGHEDALILAGRILKAVAETPLTGDHLEPVGPVTVSAGLAIMPEHGTNVMDLIALADRAMYRAKGSGRNRIQIWDENAPLPLEQVA
jgi:diguanylate cyclase (GGDEF)-like protein